MKHNFLTVGLFGSLALLLVVAPAPAARPD